jgi:SAM-dependent methyltransferase
MDSKEVGLVIGLIVGRYLLKSDDLHYGYWPEGLAVEIANWPKAQAHHSELILSHIPAGVKTILDVGCGAGAFSQKLVRHGYKVESVSPSPLLAQEARKRLGDDCRIYETKFEHLETESRFDLILFSESFQYVGMGKSLPKVVRLLNPGGHLLVCDFFKKDAEGGGVLGGGHYLQKFYDRMSQQPFEPVVDKDITAEVSPTMDLVNDFLQQAGLPVRDLVYQLTQSRYPLLSRFIAWKYRRKLQQIDDKYFSGRRNAETFRRYKSYRLLLYKRRPLPASA